MDQNLGSNRHKTRLDTKTTNHKPEFGPKSHLWSMSLRKMSPQNRKPKRRTRHLTGSRIGRNSVHIMCALATLLISLNAACAGTELIEAADVSKDGYRSKSVDLRPKRHSIEEQQPTERRMDPKRNLIRPNEMEFESTGSSSLDDRNALFAGSVDSIDQHLAQRQTLQIVRLFAPEAVQNGSENVTLDCMFKYDKKLDQRLTVKWYFNEELEPIYQWIPELNKRVYSDKYERFIDKNYAVSDDIDYLLSAYRILQQQEPASSASASEVEPEVDDERRVLAERLDTLAKLGGQRARQLVGQVRAALALARYPATTNAPNDDDTANYDIADEEQQVPDRLKSFRALRLVRPTSELSGRYTCSVSSLDSDALASTRLIVYEPAKSFTFNVTRAPNQQYNLTCRAGPTFPRPSLALYRYKATESSSTGELHTGEFISGTSGLAQARPRGLASTQLRQEPLVGLQTQVTVSARQTPAPEVANEIAAAVAHEDNANIRWHKNSPQKEELEQQGSNTLYEIVAWALVDEASLSYNLATQFECQLSIEGALNYERRQSLALQRGWHLSGHSVGGSAALVARSTLLGVLSALASLLCLTLASVSTLVAFKLLRRFAARRRRVHSGAEPTSGRFGGGANGGASETGIAPTISAQLEATKQSGSTTSLGMDNRRQASKWLTFWHPKEGLPALKSNLPQTGSQRSARSAGSSIDGRCSTSSTAGEPAPADKETDSGGAITEPEGVYRVPGDALAQSRHTAQANGLAFETRLVIGGGNAGGGSQTANRWPPYNGVPVYAPYNNNGLQCVATASSHDLADPMKHESSSINAILTSGSPALHLANNNNGSSFAAATLSAAQMAAAAADGLPRLMQRADADRTSSNRQQQRQTIAVNGKALYC